MVFYFFSGVLEGKSSFSLGDFDFFLGLGEGSFGPFGDDSDRLITFKTA